MRGDPVAVVIGGLRFDTSRCKLLGSVRVRSTTGPAAQRRHRSWSEALYVTQNGRYFLACRGGRQTRFRVWHEGEYRAGKHVQPLCKAEALQWCLDNSRFQVLAQVLAAPDPPVTRQRRIEVVR